MSKNILSPEYRASLAHPEIVQQASEKKWKELTVATQSWDWNEAKKIQKSYRDLLTELGALDSQKIEAMLQGLDMAFIEADEKQNQKRIENILNFQKQLLKELEIVKMAEKMNRDQYAN